MFFCLKKSETRRGGKDKANGQWSRQSTPDTCTLLSYVGIVCEIPKEARDSIKNQDHISA